jgi:hypothetical protein
LAAFLADARRLARESPQEVQLRAPDAPFADQLDFRNARGMQREDPLHTDARGDLTHGERRIDPRPAAGDAHTLEGL